MISTSRASSKSGHQSAAVVPAGHSAVVRDRLKATPSTISEDASAERMAVLAIAHHNLAVEQEALRLPQEASRSFGEAAAIASQQLGDDHPVATALRATYEANLIARD